MTVYVCNGAMLVRFIFIQRYSEREKALFFCVDRQHKYNKLAFSNELKNKNEKKLVSKIPYVNIVFMLNKLKNWHEIVRYVDAHRFVFALGRSFC